MTRSLYEILGVAPSAGGAELRAAMDRIEQALGEAADAASAGALNVAREAFAVLSNPAKRAVYDDKLAKRAADAEPRGAMLPPGGSPEGRSGRRFGNAPKSGGLVGADFPRNPSSWLFALVLAVVLAFWLHEKQAVHRLEARLESTEQAMLQAAMAKDKALRAREEAAARAQAEADREKNELMETRQRSIDSYKDVLSKQIEAQTHIADRNLEAVAPRLQAEAARIYAESDLAQATSRLVDAKAQGEKLTLRERTYDYNNRVSDDYYRYTAELRLREAYRQQSLSGQDRIVRVNPGLIR